MSTSEFRDELITYEDGIEEEGLEEEENILHPEDFLNKNTSSFQCLAQVTISRSSLLLDPYYWFPELTDPKLDTFLDTDEPEPIYDKAGKIKYLEMCKKLEVQPYRRVLNSLENSHLDLSFFGLNSLEMRAICDALAMNKYVEKLSLEENFLSPESVGFLDGMLLRNSTIRELNLKFCNIGPEGAEKIRNGFAFNKCIENLDLSHNNLEDDGALYVAKAMAKNNCVEILNLSHNKLGSEALKHLAETITENYTLMELDISYNQLYMEDGMTEFMAALLDNMTLQRLDFSFCGIGDKDNMRPIYNYLKSDQATLMDFDLSNNRICGMSGTMLKNGLKFNETLVHLYLASNPMSPAEVEQLAAVVYEPRGDLKCNLKLLDFSNMVVYKSFIKVRNKCQKAGCQIKYGSILSNWKIGLPDIKPILCHRAKFVAMNQKKKKYRQDFGIFLLRLPKQPIGRGEMGDFMDKYKIKLDNELNEQILRTFVNKDGEFVIEKLIDEYMRLYPETELPPVKKKKRKGKKVKKVISGEQTMSEQTESEYTDYTYMSSAILTEQTEEVEEEEDDEEQTVDEEHEGEKSEGIVQLGSEKISNADTDTYTSDLFKDVLDGADQSDITN